MLVQVVPYHLQALGGTLSDLLLVLSLEPQVDSADERCPCHESTEDRPHQHIDVASLYRRDGWVHVHRWATFLRSGRDDLMCSHPAHPHFRIASAGALPRNLVRASDASTANPSACLTSAVSSRSSRSKLLRFWISLSRSLLWA